LGFLDVQAVVPDSIDEDIEDSVWYLIKSRREGDYRDVETWSKKRLLTMAITWYLGLRTWSSSRKLCRRPDLIRDSKIIQTDIEGNDLFDCTTRPKFKFVGMVRGRDIDLDGDVWIKIYPEPPDFIDDETVIFRPRQHLPSTIRDMGFA